MQKSNGFVHLILLLFIALAVILSTLFISFNKQDRIQNPVSNQITINTPSETEINWEIPDIPSEVSWQVKNLTRDEVEEAKLYMMHWSLNNSYGRIPFPATVYFTDIVYDDPKDILDTSAFGIRFSEQMINNKWVDQISHGEKMISGTSGDGVFSSSYSKVKVRNNYIRSVGYTYDMTPTTWNGPGSEVKCPCKLHLEIFIGDELRLEEL